MSAQKADLCYPDQTTHALSGPMISTEDRPVAKFKPLVCQICTRVANCCNYGVSSCNACKMFFRRAVVFGPTYTCRKKNECFTNIESEPKLPNCQACRYQKCISVGMTFAPRKIPEFFDAKYSELTRLICQLMSQDVKRSNILLRQYTSENINLREMVEKRSSVKLVVKNPSEKLTTDEWTFIYTFSTADFLMSLSFMQFLESADKVRLIESYAYKASMAFYAMRSMNERSDKYVTPDGGDGLPKVIVDMFKNSKGFCERLRSLLITKFIELKITNEELLILLGVFFCNPAVPSLSDHAKHVVTTNQMVYCQSLLQLCLHTHQQSGPSRFMNLLSLCHVIDRNYEQLQSAAIMCVLNKPDYQFPRIIDKVFDFPDSSGDDKKLILRPIQLLIRFLVMQSDSNELERTFLTSTCQICYSPAIHRHYGVLSCNSCKMFFKRSTLLESKWKCPFKNQCFDVVPVSTKRSRCKACRFQRCLSQGMYIDPRLVYKLNDRSSVVGKVIGQLIYHDTRRSKLLMHQFTAEDLNLAELVRQRGHVQFEMKRPNWRLSVQEWNVLYAFTTAEFFLNLDFMGLLETSEKVTLIEHFTIKASFSFLALRSMNERSDRLITPEGTDALPEALALLFGQSNSFCQQLRSLLVSKFIELNITREELLLLTAVLFCSPALPDLSIDSRNILASHQKIYNNALLQICLLKHQHAGPARYADLLSLCQVIDKNHSNAQFATLMLTMLRPDLKLPRVVADSQL